MHDDEALRTNEAAKFLGVKERWLAERRADGLGPVFCRLTARAIRYRRQDLEKFMNERMHRSTTEYPE